MNATDVELVYLAKVRDERAFAELARRHQARLRAFLLRLSGDPSIVDDIAQTTFLKAHQGVADFRGGSSFRSWLFAIAYREFLQQRRRDTAETKLRNAVETEAQSISAAAPSHEFSIEVKDALKTLPENERASLLLCDAAGFTHAEAAAALAAPLGTVKSWVAQGRRRMREALAPSQTEHGAETALSRNQNGVCHVG